MKSRPPLTALAFIALSIAAARAQGADKPNVLFILCDDYGVMDVGVEGSTFYETPHIDGLARKGMRFTQGYATCSVCSPSRASIMLGKFAARHGITDWIGAAVGPRMAAQKRMPLMPPSYVANLPADDVTLAEAFKEAGYTTFFAGKWHLGSKGSWPEEHGFDINKGGWNVGSPGGGYFAPWENPRLESGPRGESLPQRLADETAAFIKHHEDQPFLAYLSFYSVHSPLQTSRERWAKFRAKAAQLPAPAERFLIDRTLPVRQVQDHPVYAGMIAAMDDAVGTVLAALEEAGVADNTIVCFTSDNGGVSSGDAFSSSMLPYRGGKGRQWEGGTREPFYIYAPGVTRPGSTNATPATGADFYPTLLELAGLPSRLNQHVDGTSLVSCLRGGGLPERPLFWHYPHYSNQGGDPSSTIRRGDWKLIYYWEDDHSELYRLPDDIGEQHDLASQEPERTSQLRTELLAWLNSVDAKYPEPWPDYSPDMLRQNQERALKQKASLERSHAAVLQPDWQPNTDWWSSQTTAD